LCYNKCMKNDALNRTKLNSLSKDAVILLLLQLSENFQLLSEQNSVIQKQNEQLIRQNESLKEQLAILTTHRFGRKTEASAQIPGQLSLDFGDQDILNEVEVIVEEGMPEEP
jgi:transposase